MIFASHLHPCNISPPSSSTKLHLSSIQASSQNHTGFKMCVSPPSRSFLNWRIVSQLHPCPISPYPRLKMCISTQSRSLSTPARSRDLCLLSTQAPRFTFPRCLSWILPQSGTWYLHLTYIQLTSHLHPTQPNYILVPSKHYLKPIQVSRCVSPPSRSFLNWRIVSAPPSSHITLSTSQDVHLNSIQVPHLNPIQVSRVVFPLHPGSLCQVENCISAPSQSHITPSTSSCFSTPPRSRDLCRFRLPDSRFLCLSWILPQSGSRYLHLAYIQETSHLQPGHLPRLPPTCILVPSKHHPKCIHVSKCVFTSIQVLCQVNPGPISTPPRSRSSSPDSVFFVSSQSGSMIFTSHISPSSSQITSKPITSIQVLSLSSILSPISPYPRLKVCISSIQVPSQPTQVSRFVSPLHPGSQFVFLLCLSWILPLIWVQIFPTSR